MKKYSISLLIAVAFCWTAQAQVEKRVEVVKDYVPGVGAAAKLPVEPTMRDTVTLHPDIDYTIVPHAVQTQLQVPAFKPATVTYWEFQHHYPCYLMVGAGYPLQSAADFYVSTARKDKGYAVGYLNHRGTYADLADLFGTKQTATRTRNRVGADGGYWLGHHLLAGSASYGYNTDRRYATPSDARIGVETGQMSIRYGDEFADLKKLNFDVHLSAAYHNDRSDQRDGIALRQADVAGGMKLARDLTQRHTLAFAADYNGAYGYRTLDAANRHTLLAGVFYTYRSQRTFRMELGACYGMDKVSGRGASHYVLPHVDLRFNVADGAFVPYFTARGELADNSYFALVERNIYTAYTDNLLSLPSTVTYNLRVGIDGHSSGSRFAYRIWGGVNFYENSLYWYNVGVAYAGVTNARRNLWSLNAEMDIKPTSALTISAGVHGYKYTGTARVNDTELCAGLPQVRGSLRVGYAWRRFTLAASAEAVGVQKWTMWGRSLLGAAEIFTAPAYVDVGLEADWRVKGQWTIFADLSNLANMKIYRYAAYRDYGVGGMAGIKVQF